MKCVNGGKLIWLVEVTQAKILIF